MIWLDVVYALAVSLAATVLCLNQF
jgi:hypothetical protein